MTFCLLTGVYLHAKVHGLEAWLDVREAGLLCMIVIAGIAQQTR